jgi:hypothetical protein
MQPLPSVLHVSMSPAEHTFPLVPEHVVSLLHAQLADPATPPHTS